MRDLRGVTGQIILFASAAGKIDGLGSGAHYASSKAGAICFTKSLALRAVPYKINGNAVCPEPIHTAMTDAWGDSVNRSFAHGIPWKEQGDPEEVAAAVAFPASDSACCITEETLDLNGAVIMDQSQCRLPRH